MRKLLLATSAAALVLTLAEYGFAHEERPLPANPTVAPAETTTPAGLMFTKPGGEAFAKPQKLAVSNEGDVTAAPSPPAETPAKDPAVGEKSQSSTPPAAPAEAVAPPNDPAKPTAEQTKPATEQNKSTAEQTPATVDPIKPAAEQSKPSTDQAAKPADQATPAPVVASDAVAAPLKELIEAKLKQYVPAEHDRAGVLAFYQGRNFAPLWTKDGKTVARTKQAADFLAGVGADGLEPTEYPRPQFADSDPAKLAADELTMTNSVLTFARQASVGRVPYSRVSSAISYDHKNQAPNPADVLGKVADSNDVHATLDSYNPQAPQYKALKALLAEARSGKAPEAKTEAKAEPATKGKKGRHAEEAKAESKADRAKSINPEVIIANMERWRWMPHQLGAVYAMVNLPDFTLKVVKDGKTEWTTRIVDGKPGEHATPLLAETIKYITVNPTWNVPPSIIKNEYMPALAQDPDALSRIGLRVTHNSDGSIRIFQPPGDRNALGRLRFNFPNKFLVYQHDTPDKYLFAKSERAYSHGCMRVQNPDQYAEVLLNLSQPEEKYTAARIRSMYGSSERNINLKHPVPVYLTYQTVFVDDAGKPQTRGDVYGLDRRTIAALRGERLSPDSAPVARNTTSKPIRSARRDRDRDDADAAYNSGWGFGRTTPGYISSAQGPDRFRAQ